MKETIKFFMTNLTIGLAIVILTAISFIGYTSINANAIKDSDLLGLWRCDASNSLMAIKERREISIIRNNKNKNGIYYYNFVDSLLSLTFNEENNKQTYTYTIISFKENELSFMDENGRIISCYKKSLIKQNKGLVSN